MSNTLTLHVLKQQSDLSYAQFRAMLGLELFGLFNVHINRSGSYWDNHIFPYYFDLGLEMAYYQHL